MKQIFEAIEKKDIETLKQCSVETFLETNEDGETPFMRAIKTGWDEAVEFFMSLETKPFINCVNLDGESALHYALYDNKDDLGVKLVESGVEINKGSNQNFTPIMCAAGCKCVKTAKMLIELGVDLDQQSEFGSTALIHAAVSGNGEIVTMLLARGADKTKRDMYNMDAASLAAWNGKKELSNYIINYKTEITETKVLLN